PAPDEHERRHTSGRLADGHAPGTADAFGGTERIVVLRCAVCRVVYQWRFARYCRGRVRASALAEESRHGNRHCDRHFGGATSISFGAGDLRKDEQCVAELDRYL